MRKVRVTCVQPVVAWRQSMFTTMGTLPQANISNQNLGTNSRFVTTQATNYTSTSTHLILRNNRLSSVVVPIIPRLNNKDNKGI